MQQPGHIISDNGERIGLVSAVGDVTLSQPDRVMRDTATNEEVAREARPDLNVQSVDVVWEDGSKSTLIENIDRWSVLGSVAEYPAYGDPNTPPPPGFMGELPEQKAFVAEIIGRAGQYLAEVRAAGPLAASRAAARREVTVVDEGDLKVVS